MSNHKPAEAAMAVQLVAGGMSTRQAAAQAKLSHKSCVAACKRAGVRSTLAVGRPRKQPP